DPARGLAGGGRALGEARAQLVVVVAGQAALAPGLLPGLVEAAAGVVYQLQVALQAAITQQESQARGGDHGLALALDAVSQAVLVLGLDRHRQYLAGGFDPCKVAGMDGKGGGCKEQQGEQGAGAARGASCGHGDYSRT